MKTLNRKEFKSVEIDYSSDYSGAFYCGVRHDGTKEKLTLVEYKGLCNYLDLKVVVRKIESERRTSGRV